MPKYAFVRACVLRLCLSLCQVRSEMAAKRALMVYRLNKAAFDYVIGEIHAKFMTSKVLYGSETKSKIQDWYMVIGTS